MDYTATMKVVLITGASSGIDAATVKRFAEDGYSVAFSYNNNEAGAEQVAATVKEHGVNVLYQQADVTDTQLVQELVQATYQEFGRIDVLVNNAGGYTDGDEWDGAADVWRQTLEQNLLSVMQASKCCTPIFKEYYPTFQGGALSIQW